MRPLLLSLAAAAIVIAAPLPLWSQDASPPPPPKLDRGADVNDWEAYFDYGVSNLKHSTSKADAAFYWACRLNPTRAEPLYARWIAFWLSDASEFEDYVRENPRVLADKQVIAGDSLRLRAWERNPFVNQALLMFLIEQITGVWGDDPYTRAWVQYANGYYPQATDLFAAAVRGNPQHYWMRYDLALVYAQTNQYDSAATQVEYIITQLRKPDQKELVYVYQSKEMMEYALGLLYAAKGRWGDARDAQSRALQENLAFAPAHVALAQLAAVRRDTGTAAREFGLAAELAPKDGAMHYWYGTALDRALRHDEAVTELQMAITLEPYFADSYLALATAYDGQKDSVKAAAAYTEYAKHAPRSAGDAIDRARARATQLSARPSP